jgi:hypothetical protein
VTANLTLRKCLELRIPSRPSLAEFGASHDPLRFVPEFSKSFTRSDRSPKSLPGDVEPTNNGCERALRFAVIHRKGMGKYAM